MSKQKMIFKVREHFTYYVLLPNSTKPKHIYKAGTLLELDDPSQDKQAHKLIPIDSEALAALQKADEECGCDNAQVISIDTPIQEEPEDALSTSATFVKQSESTEESSPSEEQVTDAPTPEEIKTSEDNKKLKASARTKLLKGSKKKKGN